MLAFIICINSGQWYCFWNSAKNLFLFLENNATKLRKERGLLLKHYSFNPFFSFLMCYFTHTTIYATNEVPKHNHMGKSHMSPQEHCQHLTLSVCSPLSDSSASLTEAEFSIIIPWFIPLNFLFGNKLKSTYTLVG